MDTKFKLTKTEAKFDVALGWFGAMFILAMVFLVALNTDLFFYAILSYGAGYITGAYFRYRRLKKIGDEIERELRDGNFDN